MSAISACIRSRLANDKHLEALACDGASSELQAWRSSPSSVARKLLTCEKRPPAWWRHCFSAGPPRRTQDSAGWHPPGLANRGALSGVRGSEWAQACAKARLQLSVAVICGEPAATTMGQHCLSGNNVLCGTRSTKAATTRAGKSCPNSRLLSGQAWRSADRLRGGLSEVFVLRGGFGICCSRWWFLVVDCWPPTGPPALLLLRPTASSGSSRVVWKTSRKKLKKQRLSDIPGSECNIAREENGRGAVPPRH